MIVAGGKGLRMGGEVPKQFLPVGGIPVLMRTLMRFREYSPELNIILVLPREQQDYWRSLCQQHHGVRPFVSVEVVRRCFEAARSAGAVVPVVPVVETLRVVGARGATSHTVPRDNYRLVQSPQCFDIQLLKAANQQPYTDAFTDDASVVEAYDHPITLVEGNRENIKLTTPFDLRVAETLCYI